MRHGMHHGVSMLVCPARGPCGAAAALVAKGGGWRRVRRADGAGGESMCEGRGDKEVVRTLW